MSDEQKKDQLLAIYEKRINEIKDILDKVKNALDRDLMLLKKYGHKCEVEWSLEDLQEFLEFKTKGEKTCD